MFSYIQLRYQVKVTEHLHHQENTMLEFYLHILKEIFWEEHQLFICTIIYYAKFMFKCKHKFRVSKNCAMVEDRESLHGDKVCPLFCIHKLIIT